MKFLYRTGEFNCEWYEIEGESIDAVLRQIAEEDDDPSKIELVQADHIMVFKQERAPYVRVGA